MDLIKGRNLQNIETLRNFEDYENIKNNFDQVNSIVFIGSNINGLESICALRKLNKNLEITVVDKYEKPFENILGKEIGEILMK